MRQSWMPIILGLFLFSIFSLTSSTLRFGYEGPTIDAAASVFTGEDHIHGVAGIVEILAYLPSAFIKHRLLPPEKLQSIKNIIFAFVHPLVTALICTVFYCFARDLYPRTRVAFVLTLILAFATMIWPYSKFGMETHQSLWMLTSCWLLYRYAVNPSRIAAAWFALAMAMLALTKATALVHCAALFFAGCYLVYAGGLWRRPGFASHAAVALVIGLTGLALLFVSNKLRFDGFLLGNRYKLGTELSTQYFWESLFGTLIGPGKSIFLFSPPLLVSLGYFRRYFARFRQLVPLYIACTCIALWYFAFSNHFNDETWGPRRLHWLIPFMLLPIGFWIEGWRERTKLLNVLSVGVVVIGIAVQGLAIMFDYTAHAFIMARHPVYSIEHNVWLPEMNAIRFNAHLLASNIAERNGNGSLDYTINWHYVPWDAPEEQPQPLVFDTSEYNHFDFWWLQERRAWGAGNYWFNQASSYVFMLFVLLAAASGIMGGILFRRAQ